MATNFPASLDAHPVAATLASHTLADDPHSVLHGDLGLAVDALETKVGIDGSTVTTSHDYKLTSLTNSGTIAVGGVSGVRIPWSMNPSVSGPAAIATGASDVVPFALQPKVSGDFTGIGGADPGFAWGMNVFTVVDTTCRGLTNIDGALIELDVYASGGTIAIARGLETGVSFSGAPAAATITQMESLRVTAPTRKLGATGGVVTNAYALFVENPTIGTTANFSILCNGIARFQNRLDITDTIANSSAGGNTQIHSGFSPADGATLELWKAATGGHALVKLLAGAYFVVHDGTNSNFLISRAGTVERINNQAVTITAGVGSPETVVTAVIGSMYHRTDGGAGTSLYVKESGVGNTGWIAK